MTTVDNNTIERRKLLAGIINSSSDIFNTVLQEHNLRAEEGGDYMVADALTSSNLKTLLLNNLEEEYNKNNMLTIEEQFRNAINKIENINVHSKNYIFNSIINELNTTIVGGKNKRTKRTNRSKIRGGKNKRTNRTKIRGGKNKRTNRSKIGGAKKNRK